MQEPRRHAPERDDGSSPVQGHAVRGFRRVFRVAVAAGSGGTADARASGARAIAGVHGKQGNWDAARERPHACPCPCPCSRPCAICRFRVRARIWTVWMRCRGVPDKPPSRSLPPSLPPFMPPFMPPSQPVHAVRSAQPPVSSHPRLRALCAIEGNNVFVCHCGFVRNE